MQFLMFLVANKSIKKNEKPVVGETRAWTVFSKTSFFEVFAQKSKKDVFEKPGQARFSPGPNPVAKGDQPEVSILSHVSFLPARDS